MPFWVVHDLGMLMVMGPDDAPIGPRPGITDGWEGTAREQLEAYSVGLREVAGSEMLEAMRRWSPSDDLIAVLLLRVLRPIFEQVETSGRPASEVFPMNPNLFEGVEGRLGHILPKYDYGHDYTFLAGLIESWLSVVIAIEQVDLDTLQLLGMFPGILLHLLAIALVFFCLVQEVSIHCSPSSKGGANEIHHIIQKTFQNSFQ